MGLKAREVRIICLRALRSKGVLLESWALSYIDAFEERSGVMAFYPSFVFEGSSFH